MKYKNEGTNIYVTVNNICCNDRQRNIKQDKMNLKNRLGQQEMSDIQVHQGKIVVRVADVDLPQLRSIAAVQEPQTLKIVDTVRAKGEKKCLHLYGIYAILDICDRQEPEYQYWSPNWRHTCRRKATFQCFKHLDN